MTLSEITVSDTAATFRACAYQDNPAKWLLRSRWLSPPGL